MKYPDRDQDQLPTEINLGNAGSVPVVQQTAINGLGYLEMGPPVIVIEQGQHKAGKHQILLHEIIHLCLERLKFKGVIRRQPSEQLITHLSSALFDLLALNGLWNGVTLEELEDFVNNIKK